MKITVQVKLSNKKEGVEPQSDGSLVVRVAAQPVDGKANKRTIELLAKYFGISKSKVTLSSGHKSKRKVFTVPS